MSDIFDDITKAIGENDRIEGPERLLSTGFPPLNKAISGKYDGGLPASRICEIFGPPSSGKTAIATMVMRSAQQEGGIPAFFDHEESFDFDLAESLGLNTKKMVYKQYKTFEQSLDRAVDLARTVRKKNEECPIVVVFDSLASMVPQAKLDKSAADYNMHDNTALARATSAAFPALAMQCNEYKFMALFLNQARTKIGVMFGDPTSTPGGAAPEFYASVRIKLGRTMLKENKEVIGQKIGAECVKNKIHRPYQKTSWDFLFNDDGSGSFDVLGGTLDHLIDIGVIEKSSGGRITWDGKSYWRKELLPKLRAEGGIDLLLPLLPE